MFVHITVFLGNVLFYIFILHDYSSNFIKVERFLTTALLIYILFSSQHDKVNNMILFRMYGIKDKTITRDGLCDTIVLLAITLVGFNNSLCLFTVPKQMHIVFLLLTT